MGGLPATTAVARSPFPLSNSHIELPMAPFLTRTLPRPAAGPAHVCSALTPRRSRVQPLLKGGFKTHRNRHSQDAALAGEETPTAEEAEETSPRVGDQVSQVASLLTGHVEALAAINVELLQAALVGTSPGGPHGSGDRAAQGPGQGQGRQSPEELLEQIHSAVLAAQRDRLHLMGEGEREAWGKASWEVFHVVRESLERLLFRLQALAADMGSSTAAVQVAHCLEEGELIPRDASAAFQWYSRASEMGNASASLKCGVMHYYGQPPAGQDSAKAYDCFSRALGQVEDAVQAHQQRMKQRSAAFDRLAPAERDAAVSSDLEYERSLQEQRSNVLTWLGRCYLEGCGVPRDVSQAAQLFRAAGNREELRELAMLKQQFALVDVSDVEPHPAVG